MKYGGVVLSVKDINKARTFYEEMFGLVVYQDYGINISFTCGLALQQEFHWLIGLAKEQVMEKTNNIEVYFEEEQFDLFVNRLSACGEIEILGNVIEHGWGQRVVRFYDPDGHLIEVGESMKMVIKRFLDRGMTMEEIAEKMDASVADLEKIRES